MAKKFILVVDDDKDLSDSMKELLERGGYGVVPAFSVKEAISKLRLQAFFCVITDIRLPDKSGEDLIEFIRSSSAPKGAQSTPILVISGFLDKHLAERIKRQVNGGFTKPFAPEALFVKLQSLAESPSGPA
mgnify:CR=1 FL=1